METVLFDLPLGVMGAGLALRWSTLVFLAAGSSLVMDIPSRAAAASTSFFSSSRVRALS
jgi:hypothetical protein